MVKFRRRGNIVDAEIARVELRRNQRILRAAIAGAKDKAWKELLTTIEEDLWGRPYRIVMKRLKGSAMAVTESLDSHELDVVISGLSPSRPMQRVNTMDFLHSRIDISSLLMK